MLRISAFAAASLAVVGAATTALGQTVVIPANYAAAEAGSSATNPWNVTAATQRVQYCYDSSYFAAAGITGPVVITSMRWRANAAAATSTWTGGTYQEVLMDLSTPSANYQSLSTSLDTNHGADRTNVKSTPVSVLSGTGNGAGVPGQWHVVVPFDTPFVYDPNAGDFLMDIKTGLWSGGTSFSQDLDFNATTVTGSRVLASSSSGFTTGTVTNGYAPVVEFTYAPVDTLRASFTATPIRGSSPLTVQFTDRSTTNGVGGVLAWAWDFDGDSVVDSTLQNPTFTYGCGVFSPSLTVVDAANPSSTITRTNLIVTDQVTPNFTFTTTGPGTVSFTDTTTPAATAWAWDFDGDSVIDSTAQNPTFVYPTVGQIPNVTLTANRLCGPSATVTKPVYTVLSLITPGTANVGSLGTQPYGAHYWFNMTVTEPAGITMQGVALSGGGGFTATANLYVSNQGWTGRTQSSAGWTLNQSGSGSRANGSPFFYITFSQPKHYAPGTYGMYIHLVGALPLSATIQASYGNSDLTINPGAVQVGANAFSGGTLSTRMHTGAFLYTKSSFDGRANSGWAGSGCVGTLGQSLAIPTSQPTLGGTFSVDVTNVPSNVVLMAWGLSNSNASGLPLPFDLTALGYDNCPLRVSTDIGILAAFTATTTATWTASIPNDPFLIGVPFYNQALVFDPTINVGGASLSDATSAVLGN
jgi:PKD repeat protein